MNDLTPERNNMVGGLCNLSFFASNLYAIYTINEENTHCVYAHFYFYV